jgi:hypothetical protein
MLSLGGHLTTDTVKRRAAAHSALKFNLAGLGNFVISKNVAKAKVMLKFSKSWPHFL